MWFSKNIYICMVSVDYAKVLIIIGIIRSFDSFNTKLTLE